MINHYKRNASSVLTASMIMLCMLTISCKTGMNITNIAKQKLVRDSIIQTGHIGYCIYDASEHKMLTAYDAEKLFIPASNTKLFTLYAGMKYIKDSINGIFYKYSNDTLIVLPTGDPTLLSNDFTSHPVLDFFKKNKKPFVLLEPATPLNPYGKGWAWDDQQEAYMTQRSIMPLYGNNIKMEWKKNFDIPQNQFAYELTTLNMRPPGFMMETKIDTSLIENKIERKPNSNAYTLTANNKSKSLEFSVPIETFGLVAAMNILQSVSTAKAITQKNPYPNRDDFKAIRSQPTDSLFRIMMHRSDNFYAEQILLMAGDELNTGFDEEKTITTLLTSDLKDIPQKPRWVDGSGLSRYNLFSPKDMVYIMEKLINEFGMDRITKILPTGGEGTLKNMLQEDKGFVFAKTGSMGNTYCISGLLKTEKGKQLLFSFMINNFSGKMSDVKKPIEKLLHELRIKN
jgi:D-alanyl-D-alanine carboxypeptidase/D-alanyl-D-alanine-endopeptidase (penicillin-binding protein 4)